MRLRYQALIALLEKHKFLRRSFLGTLQAQKKPLKILESLYLEMEDYESLDLIQNGACIDDEFLCFTKNHDQKIFIVSRHDYYDQAKCKEIAKETGIPYYEFVEFEKATN